MCPIVSFSNEKSTTDHKKSPLRFIPSSDFIIENNCNIGHNFTADTMNNPIRREWRYQMGNQTLNRRTDNIMTKRQRKINDLQNTTQKTKDRATQTALKSGDELGCSGRVGSSFSIRDTRCITLVTNSMISGEIRKDREVITTNRTYPWEFVTQMTMTFCSVHD